VVSAEPFSRGTDTVVPAEGNGDLQTLICVLVARPRRCLTLLNPVPWQNWMAAYLGYTLRMRTLFHGWPIMVKDMHTRRRRVNWLGHYVCFQNDVFVCRRMGGMLNHINSGFMVNDFCKMWMLLTHSVWHERNNCMFGSLGVETSPSETCATQEIHINGDISYAMLQYLLATGDVEVVNISSYTAIVFGLADFWISRLQYNETRQLYYING